MTNLEVFVDSNRMTAFTYAVKAGYSQIAELLHQKCAHVDDQSNTLGAAALHFACFGSDFAMV